MTCFEPLPYNLAMCFRIHPLLAVLVLLGTPCLKAAVLFSEPFASNIVGWTLGANWQIGPAVASPSTMQGFGDPGLDHTPTADNGIAGTVIGGNVPASLGLRQLTSPVINLAVPGTVTLSFWRWLNSDHMPFVRSSVEVFNGSNWITLFETRDGPPIAEDAWTQYSYDVSAYKNANFQVRFGYEVLEPAAFVMSGWNLDDLLLESAEVPEPSSGLLTAAALSAFALRRWLRRGV